MSNSSSFVDASKLMKYGSSSDSDNLSAEGGKRPKICGPGVVCAAADGIEAPSGGATGVPLAVVVAADDFSFAEEDGTGSHWCAVDGFAGSRGGALRLFFGTDDTGWA